MTEKLHGTLVYKGTPEINNIFLEEYKLYSYLISDKTHKVKACKISKALQDILNKHGFKTEMIYKISHRSRKHIFGIDVEITKQVLNGEIIELNIKVSGDTMQRIRSDIFNIIHEVKKVSNTPPQLRIWDKLENC